MTAKITLGFEDGTELSNWLSLDFREKFSDPLGSLSIMMAPEPTLRGTYNDLTEKGSLISLTVDGKLQAVMMVNERRRAVSPSDGYTISVECVSPIKVLYESTADVALSKVLQSDASVVDLVSEAVAPYGFGAVGADGDIATLKSKTGKGIKASAVNIDALKYAEAQVQPNETVYQFLARILTRQGVMLRCDLGTGLLYITAPHYDGEDMYTLRLGANDSGPVGDSFIGDVEEVDSNEGQFSFVEVLGAAIDRAGETRSNQPKARVLTAAINSTRPPFRATAALSHKPCFMRDTNSRDQKQATSVCKLRLGLAAESATYIRGTVEGVVSKTGVPWTVDTMASVFVEPFDLYESMWVSERTYRARARGDGQVNATEITLLPKGYLVLGDAP